MQKDFFKLKENHTAPRTEVLAGLTTFATMAYIIFVQPVVLKAMPLRFSITDGMAFGFISYSLLKLATGRAREAHWLIHLFAVLFVLRYAVPGLH